MPELPDVAAYVAALRPRIAGSTLVRARLLSPFALRTVEPPLSALAGLRCADVERLGKRIVLAFEGDVFVVIHLMIAGRLRWSDKPGGTLGRLALAAFDFKQGTLFLTEAGKQRRASIHVVAGREALSAHDPGGAEVGALDLAAFSSILSAENRTLKRRLTDPRAFDGIGNAYSDEILFAARLSPLRLTTSLDDAEVARLHAACREVLAEWTARLAAEFLAKFPGAGEVTAFRKEFNAHGRFGQPCRVCGKPIQRIRYADNETNYCAVCQNEGRILADRALSRLLKDDWPRSFD